MTINDIELALCDIVLRHQLRHVGLDVDDFTDPYARQVWAAVIDLYATRQAPSVRGVHAQMLERGHHLDDRDGLRLVFLPLGHLADLEDLMAIVAENGRRWRLGLNRGGESAAA